MTAAEGSPRRRAWRALGAVLIAGCVIVALLPSTPGFHWKVVTTTAHLVFLGTTFAAFRSWTPPQHRPAAALWVVGSLYVISAGFALVSLWYTWRADVMAQSVGL